MEAVVSLLVLVVVLVGAGVGALLIGDRALAPVRGGVGADGAPRLRRSSARGIVAVVTGAAGLAATIVVGAALGGPDPATGYAAPLIAAAVALGAFAAIRPARAPWRPTTAAVLESRETISRRGGLMLASLTSVAVVDLVLAAAFATPVAAYRGVSLVGALVLLAALLGATWAALRRIALEPALPVRSDGDDAAIRRASGRLVLTVAACALLAFCALVGLQAGVWMWSLAPMIDHPGALAPVGAVLTVVGTVAALAVLPTVIAAVVAVVGLVTTARSAS